jgi:phage N-6-adenine-methyltransferase
VNQETTQTRERARHRVKCRVCCTRFRPVRVDARTCSPSCRQKAYRRRLSVTETVTDNVHFSSKTDLWATPQSLFDDLNAEFGFTLDVCALPENAKCASFYTPEIDGLTQDWRGVCWMNPPYGREIGKWVAKAHASAERGATVVALLPARTDTSWWHDYVRQARDIRFLRGRVRFGEATSGAPFPSAVVVFAPDDEAHTEAV